ncbi:MAG TPA: hypothetical protein VGI86_15095 [Acidimicrobiia bacterium]|jgi:hypothetical protein
MSSTAQRRAGRSAPRAVAPTLAIAGFSLAIAVAAAIPAGATAAATSHGDARTHHTSAKHHSKRLTVKGLVASHHGRKVTVFAKTATIGRKTRHDKRITLVFTGAARHGRVRTGDHLRLVARGDGSWHSFRVRHRDHESVSDSPATLLFGTIDAINGDQLTVSAADMDNGDHHRGGDHHGHDGEGGDDVTPADHSPGGGGGGDGGGHHGHHGDGDQVTVDDTNAVITVNGSEGDLAVGDTVAILGEITDHTVVASSIFAFTSTPDFVRGNVVTIDGDNVTINDRGDGTTVSLTGVPLAINGDLGADPSQLKVGDKLLVVGTTNPESGQIVPDVAFAFNHHDHHPCGDNEGGDGEGGSDG